uniref:Uncharacterized protein n=1 Tax=Knipowitschia caucasica TaxID=637954 RepID=A0AAV2K9M8_KNICA
MYPVDVRVTADGLAQDTTPLCGPVSADLTPVLKLELRSPHSKLTREILVFGEKGESCLEGSPKPFKSCSRR